MDWRKLLVVSLMVALAGTAGCGGGDEDEMGEEEGGTAGVMGTASLSGKIQFKGKAPAGQPLGMSADPVCKAQHAKPVSDPSVAVNKNGTLPNVFVYVKEGAGSYPAPKTPVTLTQHGCMYSPRVFGAQAGQPIEIINDDGTLHNVHAMPKVNDSFNFAQANKGAKNTKSFDKPEVMVKFKCDVHSWMACYAGVVNHPFFAVTGADGTFKISGLPAGSYTLEAWSEKFGAQTVKVDVKDGEAKTADLSFQ